MRARTLVWCGVCFCVVLLLAQAQAVEVTLTVADPAGVARRGDVVTTGVPFAKGVLKDASSLSVRAGGKVLPAQFITISPWPDGSVRWALMDCQVDVPAGGRTELVVSDDGKNPAPDSPVRVQDGAEAVTVSTGPLEFSVSKTTFSVFRSLKVDGKQLITSAGRGVVLYTVDGKQVTVGTPTSVTIEQAGPMRAIVCVRGVFPGVHERLLQYTVRITAYAGKKFVKVHTWLENQGAYGYSPPQVKPEWFGFDGLALEFGLGLGETIAASCEGVSADDRFAVAQRCTPNYDWKSLNYTITSGSKELKAGARTDGVVSLRGSTGSLTTAIRHFWENYEKTVELDGRTLRLWLWPTDGEWPRQTVRGGWKNPKYLPEYRKRGMYHLPGSTHKGHEAILDFSGRDPKATRATLVEPLMARATPTYYAATEAAPGWFAPANFRTGNAGYDTKVRNWNQCALNGIDPKSKASLYYARRGGGEHRGYWYGWMDFGDNYWACGPSSLHYDWTWVMLLNYLRQGDRGFFHLGTTMARHRSEVDQCWSDRDATAYRALSRYEKGYTGTHFGTGGHGTGRPTTTHNWISGVVLYYMLTGEPKALECSIRNYEGIRLRAVEPKRKNPGPGGQTRSSGWAILALCSLYDLTAEKKYLDDAMVLFNNHFTPQWKKHGPFLQGGLSYYYSTQGLCELHHRTGDPNVLKLLEEGCEKIDTFRSNYDEWRIFLSNALAYVGHVTDEGAYIRKAEELFTTYVPSSPSPPCFRAGGQAWDKESGKLIRNGHILQYVKWKDAGGK